MVKEEKVRAVEELQKEMDKSGVIGLIEMYKMPSSQLQRIRKELRDKAEIKMVKKSTLMFAIEKSKKKELKKLEEIMPKQPAILLTDIEPFKFYTLISKLKLPTYAKEGDIVESDVKVSAGPTSLLAGPVISELQKVGIPATVKEGKIAIREDKTVLKAGEEVTAELASVLRKLKIQPVKIGLNIIAMLNGKFYKKEVLELVNEFPKQLPQAFQQALNLSVFICYPTKQNIKVLIGKAVNEAKVINDLTIKEMKSKDVKTETKEGEEEKQEGGEK